jgi:hypothetical protein
MVERRNTEAMNQFMIQYIYMWKCHSEILCTDILNKNVFLFSKTESRIINLALPVWELVPVGGEYMRKGCRRVNVLEILCTHV